MPEVIEFPYCHLHDPDIRYGGSIESFVSRTKLDTGETRQRVRYGQQLETCQVLLKLSTEEFDFFRNFVLYQLRQGTLPFKMNVPHGNYDNTLTERTVYMVGGKWKHKHIAFNYFNVTFDIEFLNPATLTADQFSVFTDLECFSLGDFEKALDDIAPYIASFDRYTREVMPWHLHNYKVFAPLEPFDDVREAIVNGDIDPQEDAYAFIDGQLTGIRFPNVQIPDGVEIIRCYIQFTAWAVNAAPTTVTITPELADDAELYSLDDYDVSNRNYGTGIDWLPPTFDKINQGGLDERSIDISAAFQEVLDNTAWTSGNALAFKFAATGFRYAHSFESFGEFYEYRPKLIFEYSEPEPAPEAPLPDEL